MKNLLDGKKVSDNIKKLLEEEVSKFNVNNNINSKPGLGIILVGNRKDSETYVRMKKNACEKIGINNFDVRLPEDISQDELILEIEKMNNNSEIHGILVQLPLPKHINTNIVLNKVKLSKDVDGFHSTNFGNLALKRFDEAILPCTPAGCMEILDYYNYDIKGKHVVVIGKSNIVGLPTSLLCLHREATLSVCHLLTKNIKEITRLADVLIVACGDPKFVKKDYIKEGVIILDVGINNIPDKTKKTGYRIVGDVDFDDVIDKVEAITPVPGGVGPMTIAMLLKNTVINFKKFNNLF